MIKVVKYTPAKVLVRCDIYLSSGKTDYTDFEITIKEGGSGGTYKITSWTSSLSIDLAHNNSYAAITAGVTFSDTAYLRYSNLQGDAGYSISYEGNKAYIYVYPSKTGNGKCKIELIKVTGPSSISIKDSIQIPYSVTCSHSYNSGTVTLEPTYTSEGKKEYTCRYCKYKKIETIPKLTAPSEFTVSYNANGGSGAPASQTKTEGTALTLSSVKPTRSSTTANYTVTLNANGGSVSTNSLSTTRTTSYSFRNWNTSASGTGTTYNSGASYTTDASVTLYAQWSSSSTTASVTFPTPSRSGYTFKGWATSSSATSGVTGSYTPNGNVTLYAVWAVISGDWGKLSWTIDTSGLLTISGSGPMNDFERESVLAWRQYADMIERST